MKINKAAIASILWMSFIALAPWALDHLTNVEGKYALLAGGCVVLIRFWMNWKNPNDTRYGPTSKTTTDEPEN